MKRLATGLFVAALFAGCASQQKSPDVSNSIRQSLDQANLKDVSVDQDRDKGVVTLKGHVASEADKSQAESIAKAAAAGQVVADEIQVLPPGDESMAKKVDSNLDDAADKGVEAALLAAKLNEGVSHSTKMGVVTLTGTVNSQSRRHAIETAAAAVPNVSQVVNEIEVKGQKASEAKGK
jgi:hyperosmotically inducible protein